MIAFPKSVSKTRVESCVLITETNRKFCVVLGRRIYRYRKKGSKWEEHGIPFEIRPRLLKGWLTYDGHKVFVTQDEDREEYADRFRSIINLGIKEKCYYIDPTEPLIKFDHKK